MKRQFILFLIIMTVVVSQGCIGSKKGVYLLPEERIYTLKAGSLVKLQLDNKPIDITFPQDMKIVHPTTLVKQEQKLNKETIKRIKVTKEKNKWIGILGSLLGIISGLMVYLRKIKK